MTLVPWRRREPAVAEMEGWPNVFGRFFERPFQHLPETFSSAQIPPMNVGEDEEAFVITIELPGMDEKDIDVEIMGNQLIVSGEKTFEEKKNGKEFHRIESEYGKFSRTVTLPSDVKPDGVHAKYKRGVLRIEIAKVKPTPSSKVKVQAS